MFALWDNFRGIIVCEQQSIRILPEAKICQPDRCSTGTACPGQTSMRVLSEDIRRTDMGGRRTFVRVDVDNGRECHPLTQTQAINGGQVKSLINDTFRLGMGNEKKLVRLRAKVADIHVHLDAILEAMSADQQ